MVKLEVVDSSNGALETYFSDLLQTSNGEKGGKYLPPHSNLNAVDSGQEQSENNSQHAGGDIIRLVTDSNSSCQKKVESKESLSIDATKQTKHRKNTSFRSQSNASETVNVKIGNLINLLSVLNYFVWSRNHQITLQSIIFDSKRLKLLNKKKTLRKLQRVHLTKPQEKLDTDTSTEKERVHDKPIETSASSCAPQNAPYCNHFDLQPKPKLLTGENLTIPLHHDQTAVDLADRRKKLQKLFNDSMLAPTLVVQPNVEAATQIKIEPSVLIEKRATNKQHQAISQSAQIKQNHRDRGVETTQPFWLEDEMDVLLFRINGLQLALPLISLGKVQVIDKNLTSMFGQADWMLGVMPNKKGTTRVVDTVKFLNPDVDIVDTKQYSYVISLEQNIWGLAVDKIEKSVRIPKSAIKWRPKRLTAPWFAGTLNERMCTLLDPVELYVEFSQHIKSPG